MIDFGLTEQQEMLKSMARSFLTKECTDKQVREAIKSEAGYSESLWREISDLGWTGLALPAEYGGGDMDFQDLAVLIEEIGRACLPTPFFESAVCSAFALLHGGSESQKKELLPSLADGEKIFTFAQIQISLDKIPSSVALRAIPSGSGYLLEGALGPIPYAHVADHIICMARTGEGTEDLNLFLLDGNDSRIGYTQVPAITGEKKFNAEFNSVEVPESAIIGELNGGWNLLQAILPKITVAKCLESVGGAQRVLEMTVEYASQREQNGHPIGSYQSIQHHCSNMLLAIDSAKLLAYKAAWMLNESLPCHREVAMAKSSIGEAYRQSTLVSHQIHGAIAYCEEHPLPLYTKRAKEWEEMFGGVDAQLELIAKNLLPAGCAG